MESVTITFAQNAVAQAATGLVAKVNAQISNAASLDEKLSVDKLEKAPGEVRAQDQDSIVELSYDPETLAAEKFTFKAHNDVKTADGQVAIAKGTETGFSRSKSGVETYYQELPTQDGKKVRQQAVVDPNEETITYREWVLA